MSSTWCIKIYRNGYTKKAINDFNVMEHKTIENKTIGIGFHNSVPVLLNNKLVNINGRQSAKSQMEKFINNMKVGDTVYLCQGINTILYQATIDSDYTYKNEYQNYGYRGDINKFVWPHQRKIKDIVRVDLRTNKTMCQTIYKITEDNIIRE